MQLNNSHGIRAASMFISIQNRRFGPTLKHPRSPCGLTPIRDVRFRISPDTYTRQLATKTALNYSRIVITDEHIHDAAAAIAHTPIKPTLGHFFPPAGPWMDSSGSYLANCPVIFRMEWPRVFAKLMRFAKLPECTNLCSSFIMRFAFLR